MLRSLVAALVILATLAWMTPAAAQTDAEAPVDVPVSDEWLDFAIPGLIEEIALLGAADVLEPNPIVGFILEWTGLAEFVEFDDFDLIDELEFIDADNDAVLQLLDDQARNALSDVVLRTMEPLPSDVLDRLAAGDTGFLASGPWLDALTDLLTRNGAPPAVRRIEERRVIIDVLSSAFDDPDLSQFDDADLPLPAQAASPTTVLGDAAVSPTTAVVLDTPTTLAPSAESDSSTPTRLIAIVAIAVAFILLAVFVMGRRRTGREPRPVAAAPAPTSTDPGLVDILDISRRMTAALNEDEVRQIAVSESIRLASAEAGAFVVPVGDGALISAASTPALFAEGTVAGGALARAMETGQSTQLVSDDDPALVRVPAALAAVPVIAGGGVAGAVLVIRQANAPFTAAEVDALELLAPVTGTALRAAAAHTSAVSAADLDGLTELHNRRRLDHDLSQLTDTSTLCFAMIDVDHFKRFNDTHGHLAGDIALQSVARAIESAVRDGDAVYRYGGEEFSVLLNNCEVDEAVQVLDRVRQAVSDTPVPGADGSPQWLTISVGVTDGRGLDSSGLPASADAALYAAKDGGRDRVVTASS